jgi:hypothetical protein
LLFPRALTTQSPVEITRNRVPPHSQAELVDALKKELQNRCGKNPHYSLRAFARSLGIDQSLLTKVLAGSRALGPRTAARVAQVLGLSLAHRELSPVTIEMKLQTHRFIEEHLEMISDWHHFAILEWLLLPKARHDARGIAVALQTSPSQVLLALARLEKLGYLEKQKNGKWKVLSPHNEWVQPERTSEARKRLQKQFLSKAIEAIDQVGIEDRENGSLTIAVDRRRLPQIKKIIEKFKIEIRDTAEAARNFTDVYQLCVAFFPFTKDKGER